MTTKQKLRIVVVTFIFIIAIGVALFFRERHLEMATYVQLANEQNFVTESITTINGETDAKKIRVSIDGEFIEKISVEECSFFYQINIADFDEGWHYFEFYSDPKLAPYQAGERIWLHRLEGQPSVLIPDRLILQARESSKSLYVDYRSKLVDNYSWNGNYFNESVSAYREVPFDVNGVPMYEYESEEGNKILAYHPVRTAQWALSVYNQYLETKNEKDKESFLSSAEWLLGYQAENGSFPYPFDFSYAGRADMTMKAGWTSAMAQGQILSVFARAYSLTNDYKYIVAGNKAFSYMVNDNEDNGCAFTLKELVKGVKGLEKYGDYVIYEEYPVNHSPMF